VHPSEQYNTVQCTVYKSKSTKYFLPLYCLNQWCQNDLSAALRSRSFGPQWYKNTTNTNWYKKVYYLSEKCSVLNLELDITSKKRCNKSKKLQKCSIRQNVNRLCPTKDHQCSGFSLKAQLRPEFRMYNSVDLAKSRIW